MSVKKMRDDQKTKAELLQEVDTLRRRVSELEESKLERKQTEEALRESEGRHRSLTDDVLDSSKVGIFILDKSFEIVWVNQAMERYFGLRREEVIGKDKRRLIRKRIKDIFEDPETFVEKVFATYDNNTYIENFECHVLADGQREDRWLEHWSQPIGSGLFAGGRIEHYTDITERRRAEDALRESEKGFRGIFENIAVGVYRTTPDGQILMANPALVHMLGYSSFEELSQRNLEEEGFEPQYERLTFIEEIEREGRIVGSESTWITRGGKKLHVIENARAVRDEDGKTLYYEGTAENVTERKRAEEVLRLRNVAIGSSINGVAFVDVEGNLFYVNDSFLKLWGYSDEKQVLGKPAVGFWTDVSRVAEIREVVNNKGGWTGELVAKAKNGSTFDVQVSASLVKDENANPVCIMASFIDITERKNTEQSLRESEERLRVAISAAQMGTWRWDPSTNQDTRDASFNAILGLEAVESTQPVDDFLQRVHPEDRDMVDAEIQRSLRERRMYMAEFRIVRPDGTVRWLRDQGKPLYDENDHILYLTGAVVDITDRRRAEDALRESEKKYKTLFQGAAEGIIVADIETKEFKYVNPAICTMLGYTEDELKQIGVRDIHPKEDLEYIISEFGAQARREKTLTSNIPCLRKDGTIMYVDINTAMVLIDGRQCNVGFFTDITEHKKALEDLDEYREKMAHAEQLASLGTLSATLTHELNQPLTAIRLSIENSLAELETTSSPDTVIEDLKDGLTGVSDAASIVKRFSNLAGKSSGKIVTEVNLKAVAERIVKLLKESARRARVSLHFKGMEELPPIQSNEKDLERLFFSLVENAIQAADGKKSHRLIISGGVKDEHIELRFADDCCGIAQKNLDKIFEPFFTTRPIGERTGLGLCIVERIVSGAGGKIRVESKTGKGSTFFVTLPTSRGRRF